MTSRPCDAAGCHAPSVIWRRDGTALCGRHLDAALFLKETDGGNPGPMTPLLAPIAGPDLLAQLDAHGWVQNAWTDGDGRICAHQAVRLCQSVPGDAMLIEQVASAQGWGTEWNDDPDTTEAMVRERLSQGVTVTDDDLADTFGPQWRAVVALVRRAAVLTPADGNALADAWYAACAAARAAAGTATRAAAWAAAKDAAVAATTWDLATGGGPYTLAHRDLLMAPWAQVCGLPATLVTP